MDETKEQKEAREKREAADDKKIFQEHEKKEAAEAERERVARERKADLAKTEQERHDREAKGLPPPLDADGNPIIVPAPAPVGEVVTGWKQYKMEPCFYIGVRRQQYPDKPNSPTEINWRIRVRGGVAEACDDGDAGGVTIEVMRLPAAPTT